MKPLYAAFALAFAGSALAAEVPHPFNVHDLVMMDRVSDPQLSPDGRMLAFALRETDYAANKGVNSLWLLALGAKEAKPQRLTDNAFNASSPRWAADGKSVYFLSAKSGSDQVWRVPAVNAHDPLQVTSLPLDVGNFVLAPDGRKLAVALDVFPDCADLACTKARLEAKAADKATGQRYDQLFIRHWDSWADGRRSQLFVSDLDDHGVAAGAPRWITKGIDGDVPSKPFGDDSEYAFSPDGKSVFFDVRIAGRSEAWSTNFDIYRVPADASAAPQNLTADNPAWDGYPLVSHDGATLYYLAMKRPGFEADRFGIMEKDLASGKTREIAPQWDRSAGPLKLSADGKTLYTSADDNGQHPLFTVDIKSGKVTALTAAGNINSFALAGDTLVFGRDTLKSPSNLFRSSAKGGRETQLTHFNAERVAATQMGDFEFFTFKGWNDETVQGYVVKPAGFEKGKKYPLAFIIHGGPQGAMNDDFHYRWNPQTYAGQGYAVVTINFHGSTGYGQAFTDSISGDWGGKPLVDLQKGLAAALAKYDFIDGDRACALGASYGGYMINWIAGNWPQPWKCLISHDGVFDSRMMGYATEELWFDEWEHGGTPFEKPEVYEKFNPVNHVAAWKVPMLVVQGGLDFRIPTTQGIGAFTALQRRGIESEFLYFPNENHWVLKPHNSVQWHDTVNAWMKRWLQDGAK